MYGLKSSDEKELHGRFLKRVGWVQMPRGRRQGLMGCQWEVRFARKRAWIVNEAPPIAGVTSGQACLLSIPQFLYF